MTEINKNNDNKIDSLVYGEIEGNRPVVFSKYNNERYGKGMNTLISQVLNLIVGLVILNLKLNISIL